MSQRTQINELTGQILDAAIEVHRYLGPGLLESVYEECLCEELKLRRIPFTRQCKLPIEYKGKILDKYFQIDIYVADLIPVELKAVSELKPIDHAQIMSYMKQAKREIGLLINFNVLLLKDGFHRKILSHHYRTGY